MDGQRRPRSRATAPWMDSEFGPFQSQYGSSMIVHLLARTLLFDCPIILEKVSRNVLGNRYDRYRTHDH